MQNRTTYRQLQAEERMTIASKNHESSSLGAMARKLGLSQGTIGRELRRNGCPRLGCASKAAQAASQARRVSARPATKLNLQGTLSGVLLTLLDWKWSPEQIAGILKRVWPEDPSMQVCHETIYTAIYAQPRGELRRQLVACSRHGREHIYDLRADIDQALAAV